MSFILLPLFLALLLTLTTSSPLPTIRTKRSISSGPAITSNFPDPGVIQVGNTWYAFSTSNGQFNIPYATSTDFVTWTLGTEDALPAVGAWSDGQAVWAPDVVQLQNGIFVLYYTAGSANGSTHCIGAATSKNPEGPYTAISNYITCDASQGGAIDPAGFQDSDGSQYVVYKIDGNSIGHGGNCNNGVAPIVPTPIMLQQVSPSDGYTTIGSAIQLLDRSEADGPLIEAPSLVKAADGTYLLFFSSNCYAGSQYDTSWAYSDAVTGPWTKAQGADGAPLLVTGDDNGALYSPGGLTVATDGVHVVFHADQGTTADVRQMWTGTITVTGNDVTIF